MARLDKLKISGLRNIAHAELDCFSQLNLFHGGNGAGKTSVLEAVHMLGLGRSFRVSRHRPLIQYEASSAVVYGEVAVAEGARSSVGVSRSRSREHALKVDGRKVQSTAELAALLPLQVINSETFQLVLGAPGLRRQFLDWGVFHVEQEFLGQWRRLQRSLKQRNSLLRRGKIAPDELAPWDTEFLQAAERVSEFREKYFHAWLPMMGSVLSRLWPEGSGDTGFSLHPGWNTSFPLAEILDRQSRRDREVGYTTMGPQRAELRITHKDTPAADVLSRGQLKLLSAAMRLSQAAMLRAGNEGGRRCVLLVDDLPSELDGERRSLLCDELARLDSQVFITSVDNEMVARGFQARGLAMFHVEQGVITYQGQSG